ncbi:hypothetical protein [Pseudoalteromonas sp. S558]|uniref:hypothetical protein n=1 Tax=Pseudoalteromonas sp. S558 TaxID=2066515 RepID=UPI00110A891F|nr:hypothetical protein [Pseudoalteromonas sp. S558]TMO03128.1 hypothetical protein CWB66_11575 [Pseudoalteromonas sp. S558]
MPLSRACSDTDKGKSGFLGSPTPTPCSEIPDLTAAAKPDLTINSKVTLLVKQFFCFAAITAVAVNQKAPMHIRFGYGAISMAEITKSIQKLAQALIK